jgi:hypothetical protein
MGIDFALKQAKNVAIIALIVIALAALPESPIRRVIVYINENMPAGVHEGLKVANYYVNFGFMLMVTSIWLIAMATYYGQKFMLRLLKSQL